MYDGCDTGSRLYDPGAVAFAPPSSAIREDPTRFTLKAAIQGATTLGRDAELVQHWKAALTLVPDYPLVPDSDPPIVSDVRGGKDLRRQCRYLVGCERESYSTLRMLGRAGPRPEVCRR